MTTTQPDGTWYEAIITPEAWVNDYAMAVDAPGDVRWDATGYAAELGSALYATCAPANDPEWESGIVDNDDLFREDPSAPAWVGDWDGPFTIRVYRREASDPRPTLTGPTAAEQMATDAARAQFETAVTALRTEAARHAGSATPGPWHVDGGVVWAEGHPETVADPSDPTGQTPMQQATQVKVCDANPADAAFIAAAIALARAVLDGAPVPDAEPF